MSGQRGALTTAAPSRPKTTTVLTRATIAARRPPPRPPRISDERPGGGPAIAGGPVGGRGERRSGALLEDRHAPLALDPLLAQRVERAVGLERSDRRIDAGREGAALVQDRAEVLLLADRRQRSHDGPVGQLRVAHVEGGPEIDDDPVDLLRLEAFDRGVVRVVDARLGSGGDVVGDVLVARRADLRPEAIRLEVGDGLRLR